MSASLDRLYNLLPVVIRMRDSEAGWPLRALLQVVSEQVNLVEADISQLYENWFIETAQDWAVPYIADLIDYRPVHEAGDPGPVTSAEGRQRNKILISRREVADTIRLRRRKGTLALLDLLARDTAGWPARVVEFYQLLAVSQHVDHVHLDRGRTVDVRQGDVLDRLDGPFDEIAHTVDIRRIASRQARGRYNIPSVGLFVWRLKAYPITRAPAFVFDRAPHQYAFSILGNDTPLFTQSVPVPSPSYVADERNVPTPIRRRAFDERMLDYYGPGKSLCVYVMTESPAAGVAIKTVPADQIVAADLADWAYRPHDEQIAVDPRLGRIAFSPRHVPKGGVWVSYAYGFSADMGGGQYERSLPATDEFVEVDATKPTPPATGAAKKYLYRVNAKRSFAEDLTGARAHPPAAGPARFENIAQAVERWRSDQPAAAIIEIMDSEAYSDPLEILLGMGQRLELRAANGARPVIHLLDRYTNRGEALHVGRAAESVQPAIAAEPPAAPASTAGAPLAAPATQPAAPRSPDDCAPGLPRLIMDGLLIAGRSVQITDPLASVTIRHCTLVPGWTLAHNCEPENGNEPSIELIDTSARLIVEKSIVGSIVVSEDEVGTDPIRISLSDSILDATRTDFEALREAGGGIAFATLTILRSTVFGQVRTHAIALAENCIFDGLVEVARRQIGCMRFCYAPPGSRTPQRYECQPDLVDQGNKDQPGWLSLSSEKRQQALDAERARVRPQFNSVRYGIPPYCQLSAACAVEIRRGADDESEMGAFHDLFQPQREANLRARLDEFTPAGTDAGIIFET